MEFVNKSIKARQYKSLITILKETEFLILSFFDKSLHLSLLGLHRPVNDVVYFVVH